ncbi:MAG: hypothetical protein HDR15_11070 [Lachnospiraceae bacterium]|nr:hypothetical protein [Lachnospiraceae bacterium]
MRWNMERYRLTQILNVLLLPFTDMEQGKRDVRLECYEQYHHFMGMSNLDSDLFVRKEESHSEYIKRREQMVQYMIRYCHGHVKSEDDMKLLCELCYPMEELEQKMQEMESIRSAWDLPSNPMENISAVYLRKLASIACSLITYRDGIAAIRQWKDDGEYGKVRVKRTNSPFGKKEKDAYRETEGIFRQVSIFSKVEIWNLLCRMTVPDIYIVAAAVENKLGIEALYEQKPNIALADKLLVKSIKEGVAENHLHFNAGYDYEILWISCMNLEALLGMETEELGKEKKFQQLLMAVFRCQAARYLEDASEKRKGNGFAEWLSNEPEQEVTQLIWKLYRAEYSGLLSMEGKDELAKLYQKMSDKDGLITHDYLLGKIYSKYIEYKVSSEFILLYRCYRYTRMRVEDTFFARVFLQYLRLKNHFFMGLQEGHELQGFSFFQKKYGAVRKLIRDSDKGAMMLEVFRSQEKIESLRKLEIRITLNVRGSGMEHLHYERCREEIIRQIYDQLYDIFSSYRRYLLERVIGVKKAWYFMSREKLNLLAPEEESHVRQLIADNAVRIPTMGITFHFIKKEHLEDESGYYCWRKAGNGEREDSMHRLLRRCYMRNVALALEEIRESIPKLSEYIVGIDAASEELAMPPWMLAPVYKEMRSHKVTKPVADFGTDKVACERIQNIGFTYHVGEDYRHIISGLRYIDEVIEEFGYKAGDRLGHAIALGCDIPDWIRKNEVVALPYQEHLENLLWIWGLHAEGKLDAAIQVDMLEYEIMEIAADIYPRNEVITVNMLYRAYKRKFDLDHLEVANRLTFESGGCERVPKGNDTCGKHIYCRYDSCSGSCCSIWDEDKLLMTNYCPVFVREYKKIKLIPVRMEMMELYQTLQKYLISKIEDMGIYIEVNPTSNLAIGDFSSMEGHPIFSLHQIGETEGHHVLVTINSDDPTVFNTNVENELAYIYYAAERQGLSKSEILEWIDKIRKYGMDASFVQKEKALEQIYVEVMDILEGIERKRV